jgi:hypothetical protein
MSEEERAVLMRGGTDNPLIVFAVSFVVQWLAAIIGGYLHRKGRGLREEDRGDFNTLQGAALTLLGLIIAFSFSMAVSRYDQRKNLEEAEANAIGTEYARADLLSPEDATKLRTLLRRYTDRRISFYETRNEGELRQIDKDTAMLQGELWSALLPPALTTCSRRADERWRSATISWILLRVGALNVEFTFSSMPSTFAYPRTFSRAFSFQARNGGPGPMPTLMNSRKRWRRLLSVRPECALRATGH